MRPNYFFVRPYTWNQGQPTAVEGVGIFRRGIVLHLTPDEAIQLADTLIDIIEQEREISDDR